MSLLIQPSLRKYSGTYNLGMLGSIQFGSFGTAVIPITGVAAGDTVNYSFPQPNSMGAVTVSSIVTATNSIEVTFSPLPDALGDPVDAEFTGGQTLYVSVTK